MSNAKNKPTLQAQLAELDAILDWFNQNDIDLDEALKKFDEGVSLSEAIKKRLSELDNKITILRQRFD